MTLSEALQVWVNQRRSEGYSPHTLRAYEIQMGLLIKAVGDVPFDQLTLADLRAYIAGPGAKGVKVTTVAHRVRMIKSFFTWAVEEDLLGRSPAHKLKEPKLPERIPKALAMEDLELLRDACKTAREHALIEFLFATGCRISEACGVLKTELEWNRRAVVVTGKGNRQREVYWGFRANLWLRRYLKQRQDDCPNLFATERRPFNPLRPHEAWWIVKKVAARIGMRAFVHPHRLRHSLGTLLLNNGMPLSAVQDIFGHRDPKTTLNYARYSGHNRQLAYEQYFVQ